MAFSLFPRLPPEIRCQIWIEALPQEPRIIPYAASETPGVATVNHESREVFLKVYTKCFLPGRMMSMFGQPSYQISQYANLSIDVFLWGRGYFPDKFKSQLSMDGFQGFKHIVVLSGTHGLRPFGVSQLTNLETISLLMADAKPGEKLKNIRHDSRLVKADEQDPRWNRTERGLAQQAKSLFESKYRVNLVELTRFPSDPDEAAGGS